MSLWLGKDVFSTSNAKNSWKYCTTDASRFKNSKIRTQTYKLSILKSLNISKMLKASSDLCPIYQSLNNIDSC